MQIPESFKLFGKTITVQFDPELAVEQECLGKAVYHKHTIVLQPNTEGFTVDQQMIEQVFWHEVVHFILCKAGFGEESENEQLVDMLANGITEVMQYTADDFFTTEE